ncbi:carotenoid oxygenase [Microdochium trichocladiopsis]|uniref:Carotenoid oxygenase n=1 Tax=Microdochium trichocladiopsis TaxID=1682393 RepID=A0A9P8Y3V2_9PEZI|nr:carotenoid oxygenase [Microdochium trichocladiopsis]KAH7030667.1 carotenoid oxygenase [Microdochium trichocladiopsis]
MPTKTVESRIPGRVDLLRGPEHQEQDYEKLVRDLVEQNFDDWPNEAGFEGLTEVRGPVELKVKGYFPPWIAGTLFRTGPGQYDIDKTSSGRPYRTTHWFDGFAHSHKFEIIPPGPENRDGPVRVEYSSRRQAEKLIETIKQDGQRDRYISFSQRRDPCVGRMGKFMTVWRHGSAPEKQPDEDNSCVTVITNVPGLGPLKNGSAATESGHRAGVKSVWLTTDSNTMKQVDRDTLEPIGLAEQKELHPLLKGPMSCAHAHVDPETGDLFNYNLDLSKTSTYRVFRVNAATGTTDILATICRTDVPPAYGHSFLLSKSFVILCVGSTHISQMGLSVVWNRNIADSIEPFDESKRCKWIVVDRRPGRSGVVGTFETPAGFFFHSVNAFEDDEDDKTGDINLYCDVLYYPTLDIIRSFELDIIRGTNNGKGKYDDAYTQKGFWADEQRNRNSLPTFVRQKFVIPGTKKSNRASWVPWPVTTAVDYVTGTGGSSWRTGERLCAIKAPHVGELPTINPAYSTRRYRYFYSLPNTGKTALLDSIAKTDIDTQKSLFWDNPKGHTPGEAIFVPRPKGAAWGFDKEAGVRGDSDEEERAEDDGVLLSVVLDGFGKTSYLVCLDARTMKEVGRAECDWAIGHGFHGMHAAAVVSAP